MKFFLYILYFFRSVFLRGFFNTLKLLRSELVFEKKFDIQTSLIKKSDSTEFFHYQGASYQVLLSIFKDLDPRLKNFPFVDIGSGKGRVVFVAESAGFVRLSGIELDEELVDAARHNAKRYVLKHRDSSVQFIHGNALTHTYSNQPSVYFLFNPFSGEVLKTVLEKIKSSTSSETWFIYMNPLFRNVFDTEGAQLVKEIKTQRYLEAVIYKWPASHTA